MYNIKIQRNSMVRHSLSLLETAEIKSVINY